MSAEELHSEGAVAEENGAPEDTEHAAPEQGLSKKALKRLRRQEMYAQRKLQKKEEKKAARRAAAAERGAVQEEPVRDPEEQAAKRAERLEKRAAAREEFLRNCEADPRIVVDCAFSDVLTEKELKSLTHQLMYCHSSNKKASHPSYFYVTGVGPHMKEMLCKLPGVSEWPAFHVETRSYLELFDKDKLVYLTADSPNVLSKIEADKVYIIGGIVDRNRLKNATFKKAEAEGVATAKFPLQEHVVLDSSPVLTVNHVVDIILEYMAGQSWPEALLQVLPGRKRPALRGEAPGPGGEEAAATAAAGEGAESGQEAESN